MRIKNIVLLLFLFLAIAFQNHILSQSKVKLLVQSMHQKKITSVDLTPDGKYILSSDGDEIKLWGRTSGKLICS